MSTIQQRLNIATTSLLRRSGAEIQTIEKNRAPGLHGAVVPFAAPAAASNSVQARSFLAWPAWIAILCLTSAFGLLLVVLAYAGARVNAMWWTDPLYWSGLLLLFVPVAIRLVAESTERPGRIALIALLGTSLYLVKFLRSPLSFELHDEFLHFRTAADILHTGRLFGDNPLLPISAIFPGMEIVTSTLARASGLSITASGILIIGLTRLMLVLGLFLVYETISGSPRVAGIATLIYMLNPKFLFFDAQFSYESLALPFVALVLLALVYRAYRRPSPRLTLGLTVVAMLGMGALVVTHHLTSYAFVLFLLLWQVLNRVRIGRGVVGRLGPGGIVVLGTIMSVLWLLFVAPVVIEYLSPSVRGGITELVSILNGHSAAHQLGRSPAGQFEPLWERLTEVVATGLILVGLPFGIYYIWKHYRASSIALALAVAALAYPATLPFRLTVAGAEAADRAAGILFIALAFVLAVGVAEFKPWLLRKRWYVGLVTVLVTIIFIGNVIVGAGPSWSRLPGPYLVSADSRSIDAQSLSAMSWARSLLHPGNRIATDRVNGLLMGSYGGQYPVAHVNVGVDVSPLFLSLGFGPAQLRIVRQGRISYVVVDTRLSTGLPMEGIYFEAPEAGAFFHKTPIAPAALRKYTRLIDVSQVYDGGAILIYKLGATPREP